MDATILIAIAIVAVIALVVLLVIIKSKQQAAKRKSEMQEVFDHMVAEEGLSISQKEILTNKILAIDELKMILLFVHNLNGVQYDVIQLATINDCKVTRKGTRIVENTKSGKPLSEEHISEIQLSLLLENRSVIDIPVYIEVYDGLLEKQNLTAVAEKWQDIIRKALINPNTAASLRR
jgi:hypothetical protein